MRGLQRPGRRLPTTWVEDQRRKRLLLLLSVTFWGWGEGGGLVYPSPVSMT